MYCHKANHHLTISGVTELRENQTNMQDFLITWSVVLFCIHVVHIHTYMKARHTQTGQWQTAALQGLSSPLMQTLIPFRKGMQCPRSQGTVVWGDSWHESQGCNAGVTWNSAAMKQAFWGAQRQPVPALLPQTSHLFFGDCVLQVTLPHRLPFLFLWASRSHMKWFRAVKALYVTPYWQACVSAHLCKPTKSTPTRGNPMWATVWLTMWCQHRCAKLNRHAMLVGMWGYWTGDCAYVGWGKCSIPVPSSQFCRDLQSP